MATYMYDMSDDEVEHYLDKFQLGLKSNRCMFCSSILFVDMVMVLTYEIRLCKICHKELHLTTKFDAAWELYKDWHHDDVLLLRID